MSTPQANPPIGKMIDKQTLLFGYIAETATSSRLPRAFGTYFEANGLNASMVGLNIREDDLLFTLNGLKNSQLRGVLIDAKYGKAALKAMDFSTKEAQVAGFIDACVIQEGKLIGHIASAAALAQCIAPKADKRAAIWGAGGMAKALAMQLDARGFEEIIIIVDRVESAMELIEAVSPLVTRARFDIARANATLPFDAAGCDVIINATSVGHYAHDKALHLTSLGSDTVLADFALHGAHTASLFEAYAKEANAPYLSGYDMISQAAATHYRVWFEAEPTHETMTLTRG